MNKWQDSLLMLGKDMYRLKGEAERLEKNFTFVKSLVSALKEKHSYMYNFEKLNMISVVKAPDDRFRIFSWNIPLNDGSYLYYGAIQTKTKDGKLDLVPLLDKTFWVENPDSDILKPDHWYGAQYYDIVSMGDAYVLLGWKGHEPTYTQKVIEILHFENGVYSLGKKVFSDNPIWSRRIFKYTSQASMYLKYHKDKNSFIFDHIVPAAPNLVGKFAYYGPDLTYDAYVIEQGKLVLKSNIPFQNPPREEDHLNIVPGKAIPKKSSGF
ncbi:hypothetical protein [Sphingobacterium psychroaquaticum]|nr:hypothetical protein [Sphingobacterium psychroaquaticum]QBQ41866.1 hypothetical protein E2P86_12150 [Sphingobacterium psychroaquaticum]